jgi:predicted nucleic acid-binding protein
MKYLVDSDYVADYLGAHHHAIQLLSSFAKDDLAISLITYGEIYEGIHFGRDPQKTTKIVSAFPTLRRYTCANATDHAAVCPH